VCINKINLQQMCMCLNVDINVNVFLKVFISKNSLFRCTQNVVVDLL
jgi:hypothetical protein